MPRAPRVLGSRSGEPCITPTHVGRHERGMGVGKGLVWGLEICLWTRNPVRSSVGPGFAVPVGSQLGPSQSEHVFCVPPPPSDTFLPLTSCSGSFPFIVSRLTNNPHLGCLVCVYKNVVGCQKCACGNEISRAFRNGIGVVRERQQLAVPPPRLSYPHIHAAPCTPLHLVGIPSA